MQRGDAFDMANLLCCLLLGAGYDAFVVAGHAPEALTQGSTDSQPCPPMPPHLRGEHADLGSPTAKDSAEDGGKTKQASRYKARRRGAADESEVAKVSASLFIWLYFHVLCS